MSAFVLPTDNPNQALLDGLWHLKTAGAVNDSRNGRVLVAPGPVITQFNRPLERVMFSPLRDANPFFHLFESLWMLAGRNDVASVAVYANQMASFTDDGETLHGAYGWRWRNYFGFDQLEQLIKLLHRDPLTRRAVLSMWAPEGDLIEMAGGGGGINCKDVPCNTQVYFDLTRGVLDMTVTNRSNDVVWGAYGANVVHMSFLQEFIAGAVGVHVGKYYQFSNNYHMYLDREDCQRLLDSSPINRTEWRVKYVPDDRYLMTANTTPYPLMKPGEHWLELLGDCGAFVDSPTADHAHRCAFIRKVAVPMMTAHAMYRTGEDLEEAARVARSCAAADWATAGSEWILRRKAKRDLAAAAHE